MKNQDSYSNSAYLQAELELKQASSFDDGGPTPEDSRRAAVLREYLARFKEDHRKHQDAEKVSDAETAATREELEASLIAKYGEAAFESTMMDLACGNSPSNAIAEAWEAFNWS